MPESTDWHCIAAEPALRQLGCQSTTGLSAGEVKSRQAQYGPNELIEISGRGPGRILWEQLSETMVVLLIVAAGVSAFLHEYTDAVVILAIVILNSTLGFIQDYRAEKALAALKRMSVPTVRVRRDNTAHEVSATELVPGDIVFLEVGQFVPADARILESVNLKIQESALTGESEPVHKQTEPLKTADAPLGDRTNMAYMGTVVVYGHGQAVITAIGMQTQLGNIASSLQSVAAKPTPLQRRLAQLGRTLAIVALGIVSLVVIWGILRGEDPRLMLMTALSLAVAVVPEGLPAVATVALALGARRMFYRHALIRKLPAVETLGSVTVICSDKTGTLTENRMTVTVLEVPGSRLELNGPSAAAPEAAYSLLLIAAGLCNDAEREVDPQHPGVHAVGEPTEVALVVAAENQGFSKDELSAALPRVGEVPFDSDRKRMTTVHRIDPAAVQQLTGPAQAALQPLLDGGAEHVAFSKGAVDSLLNVCGYCWDQQAPQPLSDDSRAGILRANEELAASGMRVLGVAYRSLDDAKTDPMEEQLVYLGMVAMIDPPRREVRDAVARCRSAGIRPVMITGDHPLTAQHIARQLGIATDAQVITGQELEQMTEAEFETAAASVSTFARVAPKHKLRLVRVLQDQGQVVAMTGDGVNDAPALKQAHIGVAMGITGTDVSKEASQMVLLDDNFATIVGAVEEGRIVYDNIRKFVKYTMTSNAGEVWVMVLGPLLGMPLPLLPLQILWINLVTDGLPGLALAVEKAERDTMERPPYPPEEHIFGRGMAWDIAWIGLLMGVVSLAMGWWHWLSGDAESAHWRTIIFTTLTLSQMGNALAIRSNRDSLFRIGVFSNKLLIGSVALTFALQLAVIYWRPMQGIFNTVSLSVGELTLCIVLSTVVFWAVEAAKWWKR